MLGSLPTLLGGLGALVAWDAAGHAGGLDRQLGDGASAIAVELRHLGYSLVVGAASVVVAYGGYLFAAGRVGAGSATALFVGSVALLVALGSDP